jgi:hypothetical protein
MRIIQGVDITPEIHYDSKGNARQVISFCLHNLTFRAKSVYGLTLDGQYTEWHEDPEHGNWPEARIVPRSRLETLDGANPRSIPLLKVLGSDESTVKDILRDRNLLVKHRSYSPF